MTHPWYLSFLVLFLCLHLSYSHTAQELRTLADKAFNSGDVTNALPLYSQLLAVEPSQLNYFKRSAAYLTKKQFSQAVADLDKALQLDPSFVKGLLFRAKVHKMMGDYETSKNDYEAVLKIKKDHPEAVKEIAGLSSCMRAIEAGDQQMQAKNFAEAKRSFAHAVETAPDSVSLLVKLATANYELQEYHDVVSDMGSVLKLDKNNMAAMVLRGKAYYYLGENEVALRHFKEVLRSDPDHSDAKSLFKKLKNLERLNNLASEASNRNDFQAVHDNYEAMLNVDRWHPVSQVINLVKMCEASFKLRKYTDAASECTLCLNREPQNLDCILLRAESRIMLKEFDDAQRDLQEASRHNPNDQRVHNVHQKLQNEQRKANRKDYYKLLGVEPSATEFEIKKAFKKLALQLHPDKIVGLGDEEKAEKEKQFREIGEAYEVLNDPEKKGKYDRGEEIEPNQGNGGGGGHNPFGNFHQFFQQGGGFNFHFN